MHKIMAFSLLLLTLNNCSKSNYLKPGETAIIQSTDGMVIRTKPDLKSKSIVVAPYGALVSVLDEGPAAKLFDISSKWYRIQYGRVNGWMWGGLAKAYSSNDKAKESVYSSSPGKYESLLGYAQKTFKQVSTIDRSKPAEPGDHCLPQPNHELFVFDKGVKVEVELVGPHCHPSTKESLKLPGASFEDGFNILRASGRTSLCEPLTLEGFRSASYDSSRLNNCRKEEYSYKGFSIRQQGNTLVIETTVGGM